MASSGSLPLSIVTGFLGSGKTTLLRRLLPQPALANCFMLVNEVAAIGVDQRLLRPVNGAVRLLKNGCICCSARDEFRSALLDLVEGEGSDGGPGEISRVVLETSGLTDPGPLVETIASHPILRRRLQLAGVTTLVDCVNAAANFENYPEFSAQVAGADRIVLTKTDLAQAQAIEFATGLVRELNPFVGIIADDAAILAALTGKTRSIAPPASVQRAHAAPASPRSDIHAFCILLDDTCDWATFAVWLSLLVHAHGRKILRIKGLLDVEGTGAPVAINCVQDVVYFPEHLDDWPDGESRSLLVFIVRDIEPEQVLRSLRVFLGTDRPHLLAPSSADDPAQFVSH